MEGWAGAEQALEGLDGLMLLCCLNSSGGSANRQGGHNQSLMKKSWLYELSGSHGCIMLRCVCECEPDTLL